MELQQDVILIGRRKKIRNCFLTYWLFLTVLLLLIGINMAVVGAVCYYETEEISYVFILATGSLVTPIALGIFIKKGMEQYRLWSRSSEPTFQVFSNQIEEFETAFGKEQGLLEMSDQHLPSGVLRLKEDS